jgi:hypothetical protein
MGWWKDITAKTDKWLTKADAHLEHNLNRVADVVAGIGTTPLEKAQNELSTAWKNVQRDTTPSSLWDLVKKACSVFKEGCKEIYADIKQSITKEPPRPSF